MAYDLALNRLDHDLWFREIGDTDRFEIYPIEGADRVAQQIKINLLSFLGEWFLDVTYGVPYLEEILIKNPRMPSVETIIRSHINSIPDMIRIDALDLEWDRRTRFLRVDFQCTTNLGPIRDSVRLDVLRVRPV
jgi:hypothetical protein